VDARHKAGHDGAEKSIIYLKTLQRTDRVLISMICNPQIIPDERNQVPDTIEFLKTRRSVKPREMSGPGPSPAELETILTVGSRVPDHGKLAPWRFIVFEGDGRSRAGEVIADVFARKNPQSPPADIEVEKRRLMDAPLVIAVVSFTMVHT
jgi:hypothetical protein